MTHYETTPQGASTDQVDFVERLALATTPIAKKSPIKLSIYETTLAHLVSMARLPGFIDHARHRVRELEKTDMYAGIGKDVARCLRDQTKDLPETRLER